MKHLLKALVASIMLAGAVVPARAQYYELANQLTNVIQPALSGSMRYKGFVELAGTAGVGVNRANVIGVSTTQGFAYASWFFMGAGIGVDAVMARQSDRYGEGFPGRRPDFYERGSSATRVMLPLFSDFRFNIGTGGGTSCFIDLKIGAAWLLGDKDLRLTDKHMSNSAQLYVRPTIGVRIPLAKGDTRHAFNVGVTYQLLSSGNNYGWNDNTVTLSGFGASVSYEW